MNAHRFVVGADHPDVGTPTFRVDAHRHRHGPYGAAGALVRAIVPTIDDAGLLQRHDIEVLTVAPSLGSVLTNARPTLTSTASAEERTRFYPRARTRRVAHGLIDLVNEVVRRGGEPWTLVVDHVDAADPTDAEWLTHLLRRAHPLLRVVLTAPTAALTDDLTAAVFRYAEVERALPDEPLTTPLDGAARFVASDGTDGRWRSAYAALDARDRAALHDARAEHLAATGDDAARLGALPYHLARGSDPGGRGVAALLVAVEHCVLMGFYDTVIELGREALDLLDWDERPEDCWLVVAKVTTALTALDRADEAAELYDVACASSTSPSVHLQAAYGRAMLFTRFYDDARLDHRRAKAHINTAIAISQQLPDEDRRSFNLTFNENGLALVEMHLGDVEQALALVTAGLARLDRELGPDAQTLHRSVLRYNRALLLARIGPPEAALAEYELLLAADPHHSEYYFERAAIHRRLGDLDAAIDDYTAAIRLSPPYPEPHYNLADAALERGDTELALVHLDRALDLDPELVDAYVTRAGLRHELGDLDGALADVATGLALDATSAELHCLDGVLLLESGARTEALAAFDAAIAADPLLVAAWANRAVARYESGDALGAVSDLDAAIALDDDPDLRANRDLVLGSLAA
ncbi:MAG TPA: tetratricopeptide repeat protein [Ilumatobacteraceae bacterium]|nr:tetratricopeptide repeat protein [Ilumatobacteraceae bacterium]